MKRRIIFLALVMALSLMIVSCKDKEETEIDKIQRNYENAIKGLDVEEVEDKIFGNTEKSEIELKPEVVEGLDLLTIPNLELDWEGITVNPEKSSGYLNDLEIGKYDLDGYVTKVDRNKFNSITKEEFYGFYEDVLADIFKESIMGSVKLDFEDGTVLNIRKDKARYGIEDGRGGKKEMKNENTLCTFDIIRDGGEVKLIYINNKDKLEYIKYLTDNAPEDIKNKARYTIDIDTKLKEPNKWDIILNTTVDYMDEAEATKVFKGFYELVAGSDLYKNRDDLEISIISKSNEEGEDDEDGKRNMWYRLKYDGRVYDGKEMVEIYFSNIGEGKESATSNYLENILK